MTRPPPRATTRRPARFNPTEPVLDPPLGDGVGWVVASAGSFWWAPACRVCPCRCARRRRCSPGWSPGSRPGSSRCGYRCVRFREQGAASGPEDHSETAARLPRPGARCRVRRFAALVPARPPANPDRPQRGRSRSARSHVVHDRDRPAPAPQPTGSVSGCCERFDRPLRKFRRGFGGRRDGRPCRRNGVRQGPRLRCAAGRGARPGSGHGPGPPPSTCRPHDEGGAGRVSACSRSSRVVGAVWLTAEAGFGQLPVPEAGSAAKSSTGGHASPGLGRTAAGLGRHGSLATTRA